MTTQLDSLHARHPLDDPLPEFADRERLMVDLAEATAPESPPAVLALFALSGMDEYERVFGVRAGDELISRLSKRFVRFVQPTGTSYRSRAHEFTALINLPIDEAKPMFEPLTDSLTDQVESFRVNATLGAVLLPDEAGDAMSALILADERLAAVTHRAGRDRRKNTVR
jgi:GGDEF domain-containing protein